MTTPLFPSVIAWNVLDGGTGAWQKSSMRRHLLQGQHRQACDALLQYRFAAGFDCSTPGNKRCMGVWTRQLERHRKCLEAQP